MSSHISVFLIYFWLCSPFLIEKTKITLYGDKRLITDLSYFRPEGSLREMKETEITRALRPPVKRSPYLCWICTRGSDGVQTAATAPLTNSCRRFCRIKAVSTWFWAAASSLPFPPLTGNKSSTPVGWQQVGLHDERRNLSLQSCVSSVVAWIPNQRENSI